MARRKLLICGATGFIGRNLLARFAARDDFEVHALQFTRPADEMPGVTWHRADLRHADEVEKLVDGCEVIIQAAATTDLHGPPSQSVDGLLLRIFPQFGIPPPRIFPQFRREEFRNPTSLWEF